MSALISSTTVYFMRHAPTFWNREHRLQGGVDTDIILDTVADHFSTKDFSALAEAPDHIVVSGLKRTKQTAVALQKHLGWSDSALTSEPLLNERSWGPLEGKNHAEALAFLSSQKDLAHINTIEAMRTWWDSKDFHLPGAESIEHVAKRANMVIEKLVEKHSGEKILVVTHAGVLISLGLDHSKITERKYTR